MACILIVDDEANIRMMIHLGLQAAGYEVETASDGSDALDKFGTGTGYDLVLLDQRMPGLDGLQVLREMRRRAPSARVIMVTAFGTIDLARAAVEAGATDLLRKPFTLDVLRSVVQSALQDPARSNQSGQPGLLPGSGFDLTSINGYHIVAETGDGREETDGRGYRFAVRGPDGQSQLCDVVLPAYVIELVKAHSDRDEIPGSDPFWRWLCEESLANYLWQHAEPPPDQSLRLDDLTTGLRRWIDTVLTN